MEGLLLQSALSIAYRYQRDFVADLNLIDWGSQNHLAAVLGRALYIWDASSGDINMLMSLEGDNEYLSSVKWIPGGQHIAVGNSNHEVQVWLGCR